MKKYIAKYISESYAEIIATVLAVAAFAVIAYFLVTLSIDVHNIKSDLAQKTQKLATLESDLTDSTKVSEDLAQMLAEQADKSNNLNETLSDIADTVGTLEKLSKTDKELLQKYSKVYFLNENYVPLNLDNIPTNFLADKTKTLQFHSNVLPFLTRMLEDAQDSDATALVTSAYRSFGTQADLKSSYTVTYGSGANKFSADQGYSEHQLGTTVDLVAPGTNTDLMTSFDTTRTFQWLSNNAYRYGFILSYPKGNSYYQYEPWHWRFVGVKLARYLHTQNKNFYDLDQRFIDGYLATIFD